MNYSIAFLTSFFDLFVNFITFLIIALYWLSHRRLMHLVLRLDRGFVWLTFLFLALIALLPAIITMLNQFGNHPEAVIIYTAALAAMTIPLGSATSIPQKTPRTDIFKRGIHALKVDWYKNI